jgi:hypothetical protein
MRTAKYTIDDRLIEVNMEGSPEFAYGKHELLSNAKDDITYGRSWYPNGYQAFDFLNGPEFDLLKSGLTKSITRIMREAGVDAPEMRLEDYHKHIPSNEVHFKVVSRTRDLFSEDFNFPIIEMIPKFEELIGFGLSDVDPFSKEKMHIIVRINRPGSTDLNPPHKDIYGVWDEEGRIPHFVNLWIPICGVTSKSSLPVAPGSHLLTEDKVLRTFQGAVVDGNKYRVNAVLEWDGSSRLMRPKVDYGQVLMFSGHLIHGLAKNEQEDTTRVALEFRLFKK